MGELVLAGLGEPEPEELGVGVLLDPAVLEAEGDRVAIVVGVGVRVGVAVD
jgi:hypothetical protein